jgi:hypothetical protein
MSREGRPIKIAFFVSSYRSSEHLLRLVNTLQRGEPDAAIVIHHDVFQTPLNRAIFQGLTDVHLLSSEEPIVWGDMTLESARWRVFRWILANLTVDWVILLSEQDYPVAPPEVLRARLSTTTADAIMWGEEIDRMADDGERRERIIRYLYQYRTLPSLNLERRLPERWRAWLAKGRRVLAAGVNRYQKVLVFYKTPDELHLPSRLGLRSSKSPFSSDFPCWFHEAWYALSKKAMSRVLDYVDTHPEFVSYYSRTIIPLESATGTVVFNDPELTVDQASVHKSRWTFPSSGRPDVLGIDDVEMLVASGASFARKFDYEDRSVLDRLDEVIFQAPEQGS